jgi:hypothetical protein
MPCPCPPACPHAPIGLPRSCGSLAPPASSSAISTCRCRCDSPWPTLLFSDSAT